MGCDIHFVLERKETDSEWVGLFSSDCLPWDARRALRLKDRDYGFFGQLAHVRDNPSDGYYAQNWPKQPSRLAWLLFQQAPTDYHHVSHLPPDKFVAAWRRANPTDEKFREGHALYDLLGIESDDAAEHRVVFWFDN